MTRHWLSAALGGLLLLAAGACSDDTAGAGTDKLCTPGNNVACICRGSSERGSKLCNDDGTGYATTCKIRGNEECPDGEDVLDDAGTEAGSSGGPSEASQRCPGETVAVAAGAVVRFGASTQAASDTFNGASGACAIGTDAPDRVYQLVPAARGRLTVTVTPTSGDYSPMAYLRTGCAAGDTQVACAPPVGAGSAVSFRHDVKQNEPYWLVIDGPTGPNASGGFTVELQLEGRSFCGDGVADPGEICDDGNNVDGDGCDADCKGFDGNPPSALQCPGQVLHLWPEISASGRGSNDPTKLVGARNTFRSVSSCNVGENGNVLGNDHVYQLVAHGDGALLASLGSPDFDSQITMWKACTPDTPATGLVDGDDYCATNGELLVSGLSRDQTYWLVVEGRGEGQSSYGDYTLELLFGN